MAVVRKQENEIDADILDVELADLPADLQWREWMNRIEAVLFASSTPVDRDALTKVVGKGANIDLLIADIQADLKGKPYEVAQVAGGWMFRTRPQYAAAIRTSAELQEQQHGFTEEEMAVLCAIAYHQPITRDGLKEIFGKPISRDTLNRMRYTKMITNGPKAPRSGAPHTFVTTPEFLATFDLQSLRELPEMEQWETSGPIGSV